MDCWQDNPLYVPLRSSSGSRSLGTATSVMERMEATRSTEIANRIGQLNTNGVSERAAKLDAEQDVTTEWQRLTRHPFAQLQPLSSKLVDKKVWGEVGKPNVPSDGPTCHLTVRGTAGSETLAMIVGLISGLEEHSNSKLDFFSVPTPEMVKARRTGDGIFRRWTRERIRQLMVR